MLLANFVVEHGLFNESVGDLRSIHCNRMQPELKLMLGRTFEHDPALFEIPEFVFPT